MFTMNPDKFEAVYACYVSEFQGTLPKSKIKDLFLAPMFRNSKCKQKQYQKTLDTDSVRELADWVSSLGCG